MLATTTKQLSCGELTETEFFTRHNTTSKFIGFFLLKLNKTAGVVKNQFKEQFKLQGEWNLSIHFNRNFVLFDEIIWQNWFQKERHVNNWKILFVFLILLKMDIYFLKASGKNCSSPTLFLYIVPSEFLCDQSFLFSLGIVFDMLLPETEQGGESETLQLTAHYVWWCEWNTSHWSWLPMAFLFNFHFCF